MGCRIRWTRFLSDEVAGKRRRKQRCMNFESHSMTLKIWDHSTMDHTLEAAIAHVSTKANAPRDRVRVTRSGPNVFTVSLSGDAAPGSLA